MGAGEEGAEVAGYGEFTHAGEGVEVDYWCWHLL